MNEIPEGVWDHCKPYPSMRSRCSWCEAPRRCVSWATPACRWHQLCHLCTDFDLFIILISHKRGGSISRRIIIFCLPCIHEKPCSCPNQVALLSVTAWRFRLSQKPLRPVCKRSLAAPFKHDDYKNYSSTAVKNAVFIVEASFVAVTITVKKVGSNARSKQFNIDVRNGSKATAFFWLNLRKYTHIETSCYIQMSIR